METKVAVPAQSKFSDEVAEWIEAFDDLVVGEGHEQAAELIAALRQRAREAGISTPRALTKYRTPATASLRSVSKP
jgi:pyruvate dehydrogenase E1 component